MSKVYLLLLITACSPIMGGEVAAEPAAEVPAADCSPCVTWAAGGPSWQAAIMASTAAPPPHTSTSTRPSRRLRTQPWTPSLRAVSTAQPRNQQRTIFEVGLRLNTGVVLTLRTTLPPGFPAQGRQAARVLGKQGQGDQGDEEQGHGSQPAWTRNSHGLRF